MEATFLAIVQRAWHQKAAASVVGLFEAESKGEYQIARTVSLNPIRPIDPRATGSSRWSPSSRTKSEFDDRSSLAPKQNEPPAKTINGLQSKELAQYFGNRPNLCNVPSSPLRPQEYPCSLEKERR